MALVRSAALLLSFFLASQAIAEVKESAADAFLVTVEAITPATPAKVYAALTQPQLWWSSEHTWSGKAANLSLKAEAGGCFCEHWTEGSAEQGRVIMALPEKLLRLETALGPLQEFSLKGTLSFWLRPGDEGGTRLGVEYRVNGASNSALDTFAPDVDGMLGLQVGRLVRYLDSGNPDVPATPPVKEESESQKEARAAILEEWKKSAEGQQPTSEKVPAIPLTPPGKKTKPAKPDATRADGKQDR
ncbi:MAG: hypothetical protein ABIR62_10010 [Dokdonella sp.]|uniref:SRPBCC family protein n=1 Tax=Dokdonella sp. TaxID=2291710 RepID=UPI003264BE4D